MNIQKAVKRALEENGLIIRTSAKEPQSDTYSAIRPINSYDTCRLVVLKKGKIERACRWWNPTADDLMADDWTVVKG